MEKRITVGQISDELNMDVSQLVEELKKMGIYKTSAVDELDDEEQNQLLTFLEDKPIEQEENKMMGFFCKNYKVYIDTSSLLENESEKFLDELSVYLKKYNNKLIIPYAVCNELEKHKKHTPELYKASCQAIEKIKEMDANDLIDIIGDEKENFADPVFITIFTDLRRKNKLLLIAQDRGLVDEIWALNTSKNIWDIKGISVKRINKGKMGGFLREDFQQTQENNQEKKHQKFEIKNKVTKISSDSIIVSHIPKKGDGVNSDKNGKIEIKEKIGDGGEGDVYLTNTEYVAKIYKEGKINERKHQKLKLMLEAEIREKGICWPVDILYSDDGEFVGCLMPRAKGDVLRKVFISPRVLQKKHPDWNRADLVKLCLTILKQIKYLHDRNILIGDIRMDNFLLVSPDEVYFIDTDSYQIEDFPCPVGTVYFTAPELHLDEDRKEHKNYLRTFGNESFAIATLLFMIMLPGKPPYAHQGGAMAVENIIRMDFSYPCGPNSNKKTPNGPWGFMWSHLHYKVKEMLYHTFRKDGDYSQENSRLKVSDWISVFTLYYNYIESGGLANHDPMSLDIIPTRHKKMKNKNYIVCSLCESEVLEEHTNEGICQSCLNKGETYKCEVCGKEMFFKNYDKHIKHKTKYKMCKECHEEIVMVERCNTCGKEFTLTRGEKEYYLSRNLELPKNCPDCINKKKENRESADQYAKKYNRINNVTHSYSHSEYNDTMDEAFAAMDEAFEAMDKVFDDFEEKGRWKKEKVERKRNQQQKKKNKYNQSVKYHDVSSQDKYAERNHNMYYPVENQYRRKKQSSKKRNKILLWVVIAFIITIVVIINWEVIVGAIFFIGLASAFVSTDSNRKRGSHINSHNVVFNFFRRRRRR